MLGLAAALIVGAAVLIVSLAGQDAEANATTSKVGAVLLALVLIGPSAMAGLLLVDRQPRLALLGYLSAGVGLAAFVAISVKAIEGSSLLYGGGDWQLQGILVALALAAGQISLVLAYGHKDDPQPLRLLGFATAALVAVIGILIAYEASDQSGDVSAKAYAILATLYLLGVALLVLFRGAGWLDRRGRVGTSLPLDHVVISVSDRAAAIRFYTVLLGAEVVERADGRIAFRVGEQLLNVHEPGVQASPFARLPVQPGGSDLCFRWPGSPQQAVALVHELAAELVAGPVPRDGAEGGGQSVYTRDPDGSLIELIAYSAT